MLRLRKTCGRSRQQGKRESIRPISSTSAQADLTSPASLFDLSTNSKRLLANKATLSNQMSERRGASRQYVRLALTPVEPVASAIPLTERRSWWLTEVNYVSK